MKYGRYLLSALLLANTLACSDADSLYCRYPCRFVFNTNTHSHSAALMAAATGRGVFCAITTTLHGGATYYAFNTNMGTSDEVIFTAEDQRSTVLLGLNNRIIVGNGNLDHLLRLRRRVPQLLLARRHSRTLIPPHAHLVGHGAVQRLPPTV